MGIWNEWKNFIKTMLTFRKTRDSLLVVNDQIGTPTYTYDLSRLLVDMVETNKYGVYHATNEGGYISWIDFACEIMKQACKINLIYGKVRVSPVGSDAYPSKTKRTSNNRLNKVKFIANRFEPLPTWQNVLSRYLKEVEV